ncbi:phage Gp37/Gp68 family protein [Methylocystis parvus]|uniref:phage Gp37/Gp68 family protein n=1 Tax=Methylocystis parvus TaxID=134 RepID=UPI003C74DB94
MAKTGIEWTDKTWNPLAGCSIVSPGCANCYAMAMASRLEAMSDTYEANHGGDPGPLKHYRGLTEYVKGKPVWTGTVKHAPESKLLEPLRWKKPARVFVNSMSDLFHEAVADETIDRIFAVMALSPHLTFQILTKRAARMREYCNGAKSKIPFLGRMPLERVHIQAAGHMEGDGSFMDELKRVANPYSLYLDCPWPLPNVWLGVTAERQQEASARIPDLLATPAAVRFVSIEPMLGEIDLTDIPWPRPVSERFAEGDDLSDSFDALRYQTEGHGRLDWVICGGESGPNARPMHPDWARSLRDQCAAAGVPFFFKQWGEWAQHKMRPGVDPGDDMRAGRVVQIRAHGEPDGHFRKGDCHVERVGKARAGRLLDGCAHNAFPEARA